MLTFLAIDVIKEIDAVFHDTVTHIAVVTICTQTKNTLFHTYIDIVLATSNCNQYL